MPLHRLALSIALCATAACHGPAERPILAQRERPAATTSAPTARVPVPGAAVVNLQLPVVKLETSKPRQWRRTHAVVLPWGDAPQSAGRRRGSQQNPEAPMAFDVAADGTVWLLDQVNQRLLQFRLDAGENPVVKATLPVSPSTQDLLVNGDGTAWLLDRLVARSATLILGATGKVLKSLPLAGEALAEPGGITALWSHQAGLWLELEHGSLQRLAGLDGAGGAPALPLSARPRPDGAFTVQALKVPPDRVLLAARALPRDDRAAPIWGADLQMPLPVWAIADLGFDPLGRTWVVVDLVRFGPDDSPVEARRVAVALDDAGHETQRLDLCAPSGPEEQFRTARLGGDGALYNMCRSDQGLRIERWAP